MYTCGDEKNELRSQTGIYSGSEAARIHEKAHVFVQAVLTCDFSCL